MILLDSNFSWIHKSTHGYFLAKKYFDYKYKKEIFLTIYDPKLNKSCYGYLFICDGKVLLSILNNLSDANGIYEIEITDQFSIVDNETSLYKIINSDNGGEKYADVSTLNKICLVNLNNKYILLINIQSSRIYYPTIASGAYFIKYLTQKDYVTKVKNLVYLIDRIVNKKQISFDLPTHGLSALVSVVNIYLGLVILITVLGIFFPTFPTT